MSIKKIISIFLLTVGVVMAADFFYPQIGETIRGWYLKSAINKQVNQIYQGTEAEENVLGEEVNKKESEIIQEEIITQIKKVPAAIYQQETVQEVTKQITEIINKRYEEIKEIPQQQLEETKKEVKKQIYQEICGEWLKDNE